MHPKARPPKLMLIPAREYMAAGSTRRRSTPYSSRPPASVLACAGVFRGEIDTVPFYGNALARGALPNIDTGATGAPRFPRAIPRMVLVYPRPGIEFSFGGPVLGDAIPGFFAPGHNFGIVALEYNFGHLTLERNFGGSCAQMQLRDSCCQLQLRGLDSLAQLRATFFPSTIPGLLLSNTGLGFGPGLEDVGRQSQ